jgi:YD repeat-containing protein
MQRGHYLWACSALALASAAEAGDTVTCSYDALGRLTATTTTGGPNGAVAKGVAYDPAGNRSAYNVTGVAVPPPPPPPPPAGNQAPVAVNDTGAVTKCDHLAVLCPLANDYDPGANTPLVLLSASYSGSLGTAVASNPQLRFLPNPSGTGTAVITCTMRDSLGATASATLILNFVQGQCP